MAAEAARELLRTGFAEMGLYRIFATCLPEKPGSPRVPEKIGMRPEGRRLPNLKIPGEWRDCSMYGILREEWNAGHQNC